MKAFQHLLSCTFAITALVAAAPQGTSSAPTTVHSTHLLLSATGTGLARNGAAVTGCAASGTRGGIALCVATNAPYWVNGTVVGGTNPLLRTAAAPTTSTSFSTSTITTSTSTSETTTASPTGTWSDTYGDMDASQFSILVLSGTKSLLVQTFGNHGGLVSYYSLKCPNDGGDFETIGGEAKTSLPSDLQFHGGNVCSGSWKIGASYDNAWLQYSNLERINVPTSNRCKPIGSSFRCVLPINPSKT